MLDFEEINQIYIFLLKIDVLKKCLNFSLR